MKTCLILDYGVGNVKSLSSFLRHQNYIVSYGKSKDEILSTDLLLLPGVGSFKTASDNISAGMREVIKQRHNLHRPILGICLGLQILYSESEEAETCKGIGIFLGKVERLKDFSRIGWDKVNADKAEEISGKYFYFNHSYAVPNLPSTEISFKSISGGYDSIVIQKKTVGVQFHPEKSQEAGSVFLKWIEDKIWSMNA